MRKVNLVIILIFTWTSLQAQEVMKCDTRVVRFDKAGSLTASEMSLFLLTLGEECRDNVEFSDSANELLFTSLDKQTSLILTTMERMQGRIEKAYILDMLTNPVSDLLDVKALATKVEKVNAGGTLRNEILKSLREAAAKQ